MGRALALKLVAAAAACLAMPAAALAVGPSQRREGGALFDVRAGKPPARPGAGSARARLQLDKALGPQGVVDTDPLTGGTRVLAKLAGFLSGPAAGDPATIALGYVRAHAAALGLGDPDLAHLKLVRRYRTLDGVTHLTWAQTYRGIPAFDNELRVNVAAGGQVVGVLGSPRGGLSVPSTRPRLGWRRALGRRGHLVGRPRLVLFGEQRGARLAWRLLVKRSATKVYDYVVDASTGSVLHRANKVDFASALVYDYYPGAATGGTQTSLALDSWLSPGATTLTGPNAHAYLDLNDTSTPTEIAPGSYAFTPVAGNVCAAPGCSWYSGAAGSWSTNENEAATQAFYYVNKFHDHMAAAPISFSQFQGSDRVNVEVDDGAATGPSAAHLNNANFSTPPAGQPPQMQMYLFAGDGFSDVNGADDASIVYHEYTHGLSNRLITDSSGYGALDTDQAGAMGEAWSDWFAFDFLAEQGYVSDTSTDGGIQGGMYTDGGSHLIRYQGINCPVGSTAATGCPGSAGAGHDGGFTYADFGRITGTGPEVHADGEIWGETLWDLRRRLIADHPGDGAQRAEMLVTHSMDLAPPQPSFLDMRNAILQEDQAAYNGVDQAAIWQVFANRGMGWNASTTSSSDTVPVADFTTPPASGSGVGTLSGRVTDSDTHVGVPGATVTLGLSGLASGTDATGAYSIGGIPAAAYPQLLPSSPGYDRNPRKVVVTPGANTLDVSLRRDWSSSSGGARVISATGSDYSGYGCGPGEALDQESPTGWSTDATGTVHSLVVALPAAVDLEEIGVYPAGVCGDSSASAVRDFTADVSKDGSTWLPYTTASFRRGDVGRLNFLFAHYLNLGSTGKGTRYVRFNVSSNQAGVTGPGKYIDVAELEVFGVPPGAIQPPVPPPPTGPIDTTKPTPFSATVVVGAKQKLKTLLKKGLPVQFTCSSRCTGAASLKAKRKSLGAAMHELVAGGKARMTVRVSKKAAKKALRKGKKWKLALRLVVTGPQGRRSFSKTVTVRR